MCFEFKNEFKNSFAPVCFHFFFYTRVILVILPATGEKLVEKDLIEMSAKT